MPANFLIESDSEIIRNILEPDLFVPDSFELIDFGFEIVLIVGKPASPDLITQLLNSEKKMVQAVKFKKPTWNMEEALAWLQENQKNFNSIDKLKKYANELKSVNNVEIFSVGKWNGDEYTVADLEEMVKAFNENKEGVRPFLKLGHDEKQGLLQKDGMPAAGWIGDLFIKGDKLMANFIDIPKKIFELIENKAYRKVSSEIFWNITIAGKKYKRMLAAVSLLGANTPGVMNLSDILANYQINPDTLKKYNDKDINIKKYNQEDKIMSKTESEILLEQELKAKEVKEQELSEQVKQFTADQEAKEKEIAELKLFKQEQEEKNATLLQEKKEAELKAFMTELKSEKLCTPGMEALVYSLMQEDKKEYSIEANKEEKNYTKNELVKEILSLQKKSFAVNLEENSEDGDNVSSNDLESKVEKYMSDKKVDYSTAYRAVMNEVTEDIIEDEDEE